MTSPPFSFQTRGGEHARSMPDTEESLFSIEIELFHFLPNLAHSEYTIEQDAPSLYTLCAVVRRKKGVRVMSKSRKKNACRPTIQLRPTRWAKSPKSGPAMVLPT